MSVSRIVAFVFALTLTAGLLAGCGADEEAAPVLLAPPTRTALPPTPSAEAVTAPSYEVVSLYGPIDTFLTRAESISALDRVDLFQQTVIDAAPECWESTLWPDMQPIEMLANQGINLTSVDVAGWRELVDEFPAAAAVEVLDETLSAAADLLPRDEPMTACVLPLPPVRFPGAEQPDSVVSSVLGNTTLIGCWGGDSCLEGIAQEGAFTYAYTAEIAESGLTGGEVSLLGWMTFAGRAAVFAQATVPEASFPWEDALTAEQESALWAIIQEDFAITYNTYPDYRNIDRYLYGYGSGDRYPEYGGMFMGEQIARAYLASQPDASWAALMALDPAALVAASGYSPPPPEAAAS